MLRRRKREPEFTGNCPDLHDADDRLIAPRAEATR